MNGDDWTTDDGYDGILHDHTLSSFLSKLIEVIAMFKFAMYGLLNLVSSLMPSIVCKMYMSLNFIRSVIKIYSTVFSLLYQTDSDAVKNQQKSKKCVL